ncbi:3-oxoacyl-ACP reductase family protein [Methylotuvimicrobium sp. KM2]|uniref:3-oxoacyl-ACP reductase family protein n=1 Tax=Methylotuvimicrobium sp. KM2 TaxID=3133976 RepID=UPI00310129D8
MTQDKVALVTGSSRGIGLMIARALSDAGHAVALGYARNASLASAEAEKIVRAGGKAIAVEIMIEDRGNVRRAIARVTSEFGDIGILVNNAAIAQEKPFETITDEDWNRMMDVNLRGAFVCSQEVINGMQKRSWGRIINITSIGGQWGGVNQVHYAVAKAGLIGLTRSLAKVYSKFGITTNAIAPGLVQTDMSTNELNTEAGREKVKNIPVGRIATVNEVASVAAFLASDDAAYITGQTINVNGGMYFG